MKDIIEKVEELLEFGGIKKQIIFLIVSGLSLIVSIFDLIPLPFDAAWVAILLCGIPIVIEALIGLITKFDIRSGVLVSIALIASVCTREIFAAGEVAFIMQLGELLEHLTVRRARSGIEKLVKLTPQSARVISDGGEKIVEAKEVKVGDIIRVLPGETVAVDGVIISGQTSINQSVMTGESLPAEKTVGDEVFSGTVNQFGAFDMRATKVGEDSSVQRMISLVRSADAGKAKIVRLADRWATWIVVIALAAAALTWVFSGEYIRAVTILVVFCPCALVLATPTAIMAAIGNATAHSFLVREGDALERLSHARTVTFDKTGTLTHGDLQVVHVGTVSGYSADEIYSFAAAAEQMSEHPLGRAIVKCYSGNVPECENFEMIPGEGVTASVGGKTVKAGNLKLMGDAKLSDGAAQETEKYLDAGSTVVYVAIDGVISGYVVLSDTVRAESENTVKSLEAFGVTPVLITGDGQKAADSAAQRLALKTVHASCLPEDKMRYIKEYQSRGGVCMVGDGINDAPAMKCADVGIAMGGVGSDIAMDAADIVLIDDEIKELPHLFALSRRMMRVIKLNIVFSMTLNFAAVALAATGILGPIAGALLHNAGSVAVIINSALLLRWRKK